MFIRRKTLKKLTDRVAQLEEYSEGHYNRLKDHARAIETLDDAQYEPENLFFSMYTVYNKYNEDDQVKPKRKKRIDVLQEKFDAMADALKLNIEKKYATQEHYIAKPVKKGKK